MAEQVTLSLRLRGLTVDLVWFEGQQEQMSDAAIHLLATKVMGLPATADIMCRDPRDGSVVAMGASLPDGLEVDVSMLTTGRSATGTFRKQLIKFENIQAHLANERTWLAWVRTALSALSVGFSLLTLIGDSKRNWFAVLAFLLGSGFLISVFTAFTTGWLRYARIRDVLMLAKRDVPTQLSRVGVSHQARLMGFLFTFLTIMFLCSSSEVS